MPLPPTFKQEVKQLKTNDKQKRVEFYELAFERKDFEGSKRYIQVLMKGSETRITGINSLIVFIKDRAIANTKEHIDFIAEQLKDIINKDIFNGECVYVDNLKPFLKLEPVLGQYNQHTNILQSLYYILGNYKELLDEDFKSAFHYYCKITDQFHSYRQVITDRGTLIVKQVTRDLDDVQGQQAAAPAAAASSETESESEFKKLIAFLRVPLEKSWVKEGDRFHSVDQSKIDSEKKEVTEQISAFIQAKETEIRFLKFCTKKLKSMPDDDPKKATETASIKAKQKILDEEIKQLEDLQKGLSKIMPASRQVFRRHKAESLFFNPKRLKENKKEKLRVLVNEIINHRYRADDGEAPAAINLSGISSRLLIAAEKAFQNAIITLTGIEESKKWYTPIYIQKITPRKYEGVDYYYGPQEKFTLASSEGDSIDVIADHKTTPPRSRLGQSFVHGIGKSENDGNYIQIENFISKLTSGGMDKEQKLAEFMIRYGRSHTIVSLKELQTVYSDATADDVRKFSCICFLVIAREQMQWLSAVEEKYFLGMAVAQARCLIMVEAGFLSFKEIFRRDKSCVFCIYSYEGLIKKIEEVAKSCDYVDQLYAEYLKTKYPEDHIKFIKKYITEEPPTLKRCVLTRKQAREDLGYVYGGNSDSEPDDGYSTELTLSLG